MRKRAGSRADDMSALWYPQGELGRAHTKGRDAGRLPPRVCFWLPPGTCHASDGTAAPESAWPMPGSFDRKSRGPILRFGRLVFNPLILISFFHPDGLPRGIPRDGGVIGGAVSRWSAAIRRVTQGTFWLPSCRS